MILSIKYHRKKANLTQKDLADAVGVDQSCVSQWETGITTPKTELIPSIARACRCRISDLFHEHDLTDECVAH